MTNALLLVPLAVLALVVYGLEHNHRRNGLHRPVSGNTNEPLY
ncbi:hypothetical protein GCM10022243_36480 [Saccharothrix violaceirubra]|uniref:Uncharacterized protein n=1 Tax=Saccharothrix violaceirubra TaxID=413306 RepID=A0A7W7T291_9PSEU|nr:hypothetical protein [Saccharothrix violaceirubra]MBB4964020.1 hypothetical protein [Saccharothrix violaceirubra]